MTGAVAGDQNQAASEPTGHYRYMVVGALAFAYMLNFVDRQLLSILVEPVKADLALSDTQIGMLTGLMFALFYTLFGIPVAILADRGNRIRLVAIACAIWSCFTALSGLATSFWTLALARIGVGIGEAGCSPPSHSILSDYFPKEQRGKAMGLYVLGLPAGAFVGTLVGGWIAETYGWRWGFIVLSLVGLAFAPLLPKIVEEPPRGRFDGAEAPISAPECPPPFLAGLRFFCGSPIFLLTALGCGLTAFCANALLAWTPAFLGRTFGLSLGQLGTALAFVTAGSMIVAAWLGALIADRSGVRNAAWFGLLPGAAILAFIPFLLAFTNAASWQAALGLLLPASILSALYLVPALALLQNRTPPQFRATVSAIFLFLLNLIGLGGGPLFVGMMSDVLTPLHGSGALSIALQWLAPVALLASFAYAASAWLLQREMAVTRAAEKRAK